MHGMLRRGARSNPASPSAASKSTNANQAQVEAAAQGTTGAVNVAADGDDELAETLVVKAALEEKPCAEADQSAAYQDEFEEEQPEAVGVDTAVDAEPEAVGGVVQADVSTASQSKKSNDVEVSDTSALEKTYGDDFEATDNSIVIQKSGCDDTFEATTTSAIPGKTAYEEEDFEASASAVGDEDPQAKQELPAQDIPDVAASQAATTEEAPLDATKPGFAEYEDEGFEDDPEEA